VVTVLAIVFSELLIGVSIGIVVSLIFIVKEDYQGTVLSVKDYGTRKRIVLGENITFLHKPKLAQILDEIPNH
jgi:MFS superfamily sulfate permease-like transporter